MIFFLESLNLEKMERRARTFFLVSGYFLSLFVPSVAESLLIGFGSDEIRFYTIFTSSCTLIVFALYSGFRLVFDKHLMTYDCETCICLGDPSQSKVEYLARGLYVTFIVLLWTLTNLICSRVYRYILTAPLTICIWMPIPIYVVGIISGAISGYICYGCEDYDDGKNGGDEGW